MFEYRFFKSQKQGNLYVHIQQNFKKQHVVRTILYKKNDVWINMKNKWLYIKKSKTKIDQQDKKNHCWMSFCIGHCIRRINEQSQKRQKSRSRTLLHCKHGRHRKNIDLKKKRQFNRKTIEKILELHTIICI